jgi:DNA-directed RNA polymerase alpha subunit
MSKQSESLISEAQLKLEQAKIALVQETSTLKTEVHNATNELELYQEKLEKLRLTLEASEIDLCRVNNALLSLKNESAPGSKNKDYSGITGIENLNLSYRVFVALKRININTFADLRESLFEESMRLTDLKRIGSKAAEEINESISKIEFFKGKIYF